MYNQKNNLKRFLSRLFLSIIINYLPAIVSISTKAPIGNDLTAKAERAGHSD
jgi:hypothetical protein